MIVQHRKTQSWYFRLPFWVWESTNDQPRERKVAYMSLRKMQVNARREHEFDDGRFQSLWSWMRGTP